MVPLQGPSVIVANDGVFCDQDWKHYTQHVGNSAKADDPHTIGHFGKGALTMYSLADTIQLLSNDRLLILDPHGHYLPGGLRSWHCQLIVPSDTTARHITTHARHQLQSFMSLTNSCPDMPDWDGTSRYPGTVFRLALRTPESAGCSQISNHCVTVEEFSQTLADFMTAASDLLLFTRQVKTISVYVKKSSDGPAGLVYGCTSAQSPLAQPSAFHVRSDKLVLNIQQGHVTPLKEWHRYSKLDSSSPLGGVAVLAAFTEGQQPTVTYPAINGKLYSTLPLPLDVQGLPLHINAPFLLSADRRHMQEGHAEGSIT